MLSITDDTTVRDILATYPEAFEVFTRHGMCEDCKADPPPVPLHHFAKKHCGGQIQELIQELTRTISR